MMGAVPRQIKACESVNDKHGKNKLTPLFACFFSGESVETNLGPRPIEEIREGDFVLTHKGRYKKVVRTFKRIYSGKAIGIKLNGKNKNITWMTEEHPVLIRNKKGNMDWVPANEINAGRNHAGNKISNYKSYVCYPKSNHNEIDLIDLSSFINGYLWDKNYCEKKYKSRQDCIWKNLEKIQILDYDFGKFIGLFVAEGSFSVNKKNKLDGGFRFSFNIKEKDLCDFCIDFSFKRWGLNGKIYLDPKHNKAEVVFCCKPIADMLLNLSGKGASKKHLPLNIFEWNFESKKGVFDGVLFGDGKNPNKKSNKTKQNTLKSASKFLVMQMKRLLIDINQWANCAKVECKKTGKIAYQLPISLEAKYRRTICDENYVYKPIKEILHKEISDVFVYNIEVEDDNSYVVNFAVHNCELYVNKAHFEATPTEESRKAFVERLDPEQLADFKVRGNHLLAIAITNEGYKNLVRLCSWGHLNGFYGRPRVNYEVLKAHKAGLVFTSCCYASEIGRTFDTKGEEAAEETLKVYMEMFRGQFYLEIMMLDFHKQKPYDKFIIKMKDKYGLPIILTQDCHYCKQEDSHYQRLMLMVQTKRTLPELQKAMQENEFQDFFELQDANLWMKTEEELNSFWAEKYTDTIPLEIFEEAKKTTVDICRSANVTIDRSIKFPTFPDEGPRLLELIVKSCQKRNITLNKEYKKRLYEEYDIITRKGFASYFIVQKMMADEARRIMPELILGGNGREAIGPGRGSGAGSLILYLLGVTDVDPIKHGLLFSRFLSEARGGKQIKLRW